LGFTMGLPEETVDLVRESVGPLEDWLERNDFRSYDPYDVKGTRLYRWLSGLPRRAGLFPLRAIRKGIAISEERFPLLTRRFLLVRKRIIPEAVGVLARAYVDLYEGTGERRYEDKALRGLNWLVRHPARGYSGFCWGYPFDWQSVMLIPAGTPTGVVSSVVGDAFWKAYQVFNDSGYLDVCRSVCQFFLNDLRRDEIDAETVCFSYTALDDFHVHNANLFVGEFLTRVGKEIGDRQCVETGRKAANYALREQNPDGSLYYWGNVQNHYSPRHIDHYHSGFEIRMLYGMWKLTGEERYRQGVARYYHFYRNNLLWRDCVPKISPGRIYPIDIHSCAEAILCNATLADEFEEARDILPGVVRWTVERMQTKGGWFIHMIRRHGGRERKVCVPYVRWGQAWMLRALSQVWAASARGPG